LAIFSFRNDNVTVTEAGVPANPAGTAFRMFAEVQGDVRTGIAVANAAASSATITVEAYRLDGASTGAAGTFTVPANGQTALFLNEIEGLEPLGTPFSGIVRLTSPSPVFAIGLRGRTNERGDFLITTTPPSDEGAPESSTDVLFPHVVDSGGYTTQIVLFSGSSAPSSGFLDLLTQSGDPVSWTPR
jgi:hypothetical protein